MRGALLLSFLEDLLVYYCSCLNMLVLKLFLHSWWFEYDRKESDKMLLLPGNPQGTFLVREATGQWKTTFVVSWGLFVCLVSQRPFQQLGYIAEGF